MAPHSQQIRLVLASASPRRKEMLESLGLRFEIDPAHVDESPRPGEAPESYVLRVAKDKAAWVAARHEKALVLAADTSVIVDGDILGKPRDAAEAKAMLRRLSARSHQVLSAVALAGASAASLVVETEVVFRPLSEEEIAWYVATGEPFDKAGGYAVQGRAGAFISRLKGSASNVIGLPLAECLELLSAAGLHMPWDER